MYPRKIPLVNINLKLGAEYFVSKKLNFSKSCYTHVIQKLNIFDNYRIIKCMKNKIQDIVKEKKTLIQKKFPETFKKYHSGNLLNLWTKYYELSFSQKLKKGHNFFNYYSKFWDDKSFKNIMYLMRINGKKRSKEITLGSVSLLAFEWDKVRISDNEMKHRINDFTYVYKLRDKTLCHDCHKKKMTENSENICHCDDYKSPDPPMKYDDWETFIEKKDLVVWRKLRETGHYEYKVYGSYNDVSAEEFVNVQVDTNYRRLWDTTAIVLETIDQDPNPKNNCEILYWEMLWPMLFTNRDYVFIRRYIVDYDTKTIFMASKSTDHPKCPEKSDKFRVKDYWSYMVIKPYTDLNKQGIEFVLTYYDNPGVSIPTKITTWVAMRAMPDFLERLRSAAKKYKAYCKQYGVKCICSIRETSLTEEEECEDYLYYFLESEEDLITDNTISEAQHNLKRVYKKGQSQKPPKPQIPLSKNNSDSKTQNDTVPPSSPSIQRGTKAFWKYLYPPYYFS